jgi:hypothetical protein
MSIVRQIGSLSVCEKQTGDEPLGQVVGAETCEKEIGRRKEE